ncbi:hypothetical protein BH23CHL2_BH23CHL2_24040 [soil metagenome]
MAAWDGPAAVASVESDDRPEPSGRGLCIRLLGDFQVTVDGRLVNDRAWRRRKAASLVKLLALAPRHRMHREAILEYLWPDQDPDSTAANLRVVRHAARRALQPAGQQGLSFLQMVNDEIVLQVNGQPWIDVEIFEREAARAERSRAQDDYKRALDLYQGELLPADRYEDWTVGRRERLHDIYLALLVGFAEALSLAGDESGSTEALERALADDPMNELAAARLMDAYARTGQRYRALRLFQQVRDALDRELEANPDNELRKLYGEILASRASQPVLLDGTPDPDRQKSNLQVPLTRFFGREDQITRTVDLLAVSRLVTLTGAGGSGKTRLAITIAGSVHATTPDGVWWVDLSSLIAGEAIPQAIASALDLRLDPALEGPPALAEGLAGKHLLLVLDNCEHLIEACAHLAGLLLHGCPLLRILATSREPLHIEGETVLRIPELPLPPEQAVSETEIAGSDAVQLFCDRARFVQPDFELTPGNAATIATICRRLDGLPLAIELAAARVSLLSLEQLADRLINPLQVLAGGRRTDEPRQQTLRATLDWSFDLLDAPERLLLIRLSVCTGGWGLDAAEAICSGDGVNRRDVLGLLAQLVDKSLVEVRADGDEARYRLLETVRQYAAEKRETADPGEVVRRRHAEYFLDLAEAAEPGLLGGEQEHWLERLELDLDNLRAAMHWLEESGDAERQLRIAAALVRMWWIRGHVNEGRRWLEGGLVLTDDAAKVSDTVRAKALQAAGNLARMQGDPDRALELLEACLAIRRIDSEPVELAHALNYLAALLGVRGRTGQRAGARSRVSGALQADWRPQRQQPGPWHAGRAQLCGR